MSAADRSQELKIIPLGGLGEIGMNCMVLEYADEIIVVDCGLLFSDLDHFGVEFVIPDFNYLRERKDKVKAFVVTHGHEDHIGALGFAIKAGIQAPVYASPFSSLLIRERFKEHGLNAEDHVRTFKIGDQLKFKHFKIRTISVNHSIVDSAALVVETPIGRIIHTGDFKIDPLPFFGETIDLKAFEHYGDQGVLLLLSDSTNVEHCDQSLSESIIYRKFEQLFAAAEGLIVVSMFASNVGRLGQVFDLAKKLGKRVALSGRSMEQNVVLAKEAGYIKDIDSVLIGVEDVKSHARKDVIVLSTGCQGEYRSSLTRIALGEHRHVNLQQGDLVLLSSKFIPGNEKAIGRVINELFKQGAQVLYEAIHDLHVSGHATRPELRRMLELTRPKYFVPIHGEYRHLVHHRQVAVETGVREENALIAINGDVIELTPESCRIADHIDETRVLVEGRDGNDISKLVLKDRRQMGEKGVVFSLLVRNTESRKIIAGPEIISKGMVSEAMEGWLIEEAKEIVKKIIAEYEKGTLDTDCGDDLQENIRVQLRRFFNDNLGKKPIVLPIVLDL